MVQGTSGVNESASRSHIVFLREKADAARLWANESNFFFCKVNEYTACSNRYGDIDGNLGKVNYL